MSNEIQLFNSIEQDAARYDQRIYVANIATALVIATIALALFGLVASNPLTIVIGLSVSTAFFITRQISLGSAQSVSQQSAGLLQWARRRPISSLFWTENSSIPLFKRPILSYQEFRQQIGC